MHEVTNHALTAVQRAGVPMKQKSKAIELVVSETVAQCLAIPPTPVSELQTYFYAHCKVKALENLAKVNEHVVIDIDRAVELVYRIWKMRYCLVHRPNDASVGRLIVTAVNANADQVPEVYRQVIREYPSVALSRFEFEDIKGEVEDA